MHYPDKSHYGLNGINPKCCLPPERLPKGFKGIFVDEENLRERQ
jgi:hypothetical protein